MIFEVATVLLIAFFTVDALVAGYAIKVFYYRVSAENNLNVIDKEKAEITYSQIENGNNFATLINNYYDDKKMIKIYPNIMIEEQNKNKVYVESLVEGVQPYYFRLGEAF